jgi:hypothetical protein
MGVVIEICAKYPGGPTRMRGTDIYTSQVGFPIGSWEITWEVESRGPLIDILSKAKQ